MPYITFKNENALYHAEKGSTWSNHKYIRIENGRYIYPEDLEGNKGTSNKTSGNAKANIQADQESIKKNILSKNETLDTDAKKELNKANASIREGLKKVVDSLKKYAETSAKHNLAAYESVTNIRNRQVNEASEEAYNNVSDFQKAFVEYKDGIREQISNIKNSKLKDSDKNRMIDEILSDYDDYKESIIKIFDASFEPYQETPKTNSRSVNDLASMYAATKYLLNQPLKY